MPICTPVDSTEAFVALLALKYVEPPLSIFKSVPTETRVSLSKYRVSTKTLPNVPCPPVIEFTPALILVDAVIPFSLIERRLA